MSKPTSGSGSDFISVLQAVREYDAQAVDWPSIGWTLLSNTTQQPLVSFLRRLCFDIGYKAEVAVGGYDTALQDATDPASGLFERSVDVVVIALRLHGLAPALLDRFVMLSADEVEAEARRALECVCGVVASVRQRTNALLLVHSFETPLHPDLGVLDYRNVDGQVNRIRRLNLDLAEAMSRQDGVYIVDLDAMRSRIGGERFTDSRTWHIGRVAYTREAMGAIAAEYMTFVRALKGRNKKCLVVDADGTLWGGIVGEDGVDGIEIGRSFPGSAFYEFQQSLLTLRERGVLLALCSKNDLQAVHEVFAARAADMPLRLDQFAAVRVNWADKARNIREIAAELNIGLDSLVFVDDNSFEVNLVQQLLPSVHAMQLPADPAQFREWLAGCGLFDSLTLSEEDRRRGGMYAAERRRQDERASSPVSLEDYLRGLAMEVQISSVDENCVARVAQLTQKTNQFNLTTRRYSETDIRARAESADHDVLAVRLSDRFGDSGLVGVAILRHGGGRSVIDTLLLSCRVLERGVEDALLAACIRRSALRGSSAIVGEFIPTAKNGRVADFFPSRGFVADGTGLFRRALAGSESVVFPGHLRAVSVDGEKVL